MWFLISRRLRGYLLFALGAPLVAWLLDALGRRLEARRGPTGLSRALRWGGRKLRRRSRGPLKHKGERPETVAVTEPGYARTEVAQEAAPRGA